MVLMICGEYQVNYENTFRKTFVSMSVTLN